VRPVVKERSAPLHVDVLDRDLVAPSIVDREDLNQAGKKTAGLHDVHPGPLGKVTASRGAPGIFASGGELDHGVVGFRRYAADHGCVVDPRPRVTRLRLRLMDSLFLLFSMLTAGDLVLTLALAFAHGVFTYALETAEKLGLEVATAWLKHEVGA
jgi:hypothetical protein